jgi:hypothetical protein
MCDLPDVLQARARDIFQWARCIGLHNIHTAKERFVTGEAT